MTNRVWNSEMQAALVELAKERLFAQEIADRMSWLFEIEITKNAIIGRARKTGVTLPYPTERIKSLLSQKQKEWAERYPEKAAIRDARLAKQRETWCAKRRMAA